MKRAEIILILFLLLVREIYSTNIYKTKICCLQKYERIERVIKDVYPNIVFDYSQAPNIYPSDLTMKDCDIAIVEPPFYDEHYDKFADINEQIQDIIDQRKGDEEDGEIYEELLKDLRNRYDLERNFDETIRALPLLMDYGILYYRNDILENPPKTWKELISLKEKYTYEQTNPKIFYSGQFNEENEFYYNLIEYVLNSDSYSSIENISDLDDQRKYEVFEKETSEAIKQFKELFRTGVLDETTWSKTSELVTTNFNSREGLLARNWSSYLQNITVSYNYANNQDVTFSKSKIIYSDERYKGGSSRAINKGIYLAVIKNEDEEKINEAVKAIIYITSKEFMKELIKNDYFFDITPYSSLLNEGNALNNTDYCGRINCGFFRDLQQNHIVAAYDVFYQKGFLEKFKEFYGKAKEYFSKNTGTQDTVMSTFSDYFRDKYVEFGSTASIIMIIIIVIEILITLLVAYYIIKYRNFIEIRRSSPLFLILMLIGIILAFGSVITFIGKPTDIICMIRPYIIVLAFGLTFYSLLLKTFRIKVIFDKVNIQVKDSYLIFYLCILLGIELALVSIWTIFANMKSEIIFISNETHYYGCKNTNVIGYFIQMFLIVINGLALLYGCYLAYKVKNVYSEYNESKVIGLSIYGIVICMIIIIFISFIDGLDHLTLFIIESLMIILSADIILIFMFTPKLWKLHINNIEDLPYEKQMYT